MYLLSEKKKKLLWYLDVAQNHGSLKIKVFDDQVCPIVWDCQDYQNHTFSASSLFKKCKGGRHIQEAEEPIKATFVFLTASIPAHLI